MIYFLIEYDWYQSLEDGEHDSGTDTELVYAPTLEIAIVKLKEHHPRLMIDNIRNKTII